MARQRTRDTKREERITMEIIVDCYNEQEQVMGWYYYLDDRLQFPFAATCVAKRAISPLHVKDEVEVFGMADQEECGHEMFVMIRWEKQCLAVPLAQPRPIRSTDEQTKQAVADWHYWVRMGYEL